MINIKIDSRKVEFGDIFVAIKGANADGHDFVDSAIEKGASKVVIDHDMDVDCDKIIVPDTVKWLTQEVSTKYSSLINEMNIIGVTGTNGKTTSCYLIYQMLNHLNSKTAYIGTIGYYVPDEVIIELPNTTPNILDLYELLLDARSKNCKNVVMEVSSHALSMQRCEGIKFKVAAFTNLTQDHLDYHITMDNYLEAKKLILNQVSETMLINADDSYSDKWVFDNKKTFGFNGFDYKILEYQDTVEGTFIKFVYDNKEYKVNTNLKSDFNVYNYMTALSIINNLGYSIENIINITKDIYPPRGRCEQISVKGGLAIIDYAHTPDAVEKIINAFNKNKKGKIITVIGCGGDRDPKKRPIMGCIATENSDYVIFTSDNPRTEDPNKILDEIINGVNKDNYEVEPDRKEAIKKALDLISDNDIVLLLGKGHEDYQIIGREKHHLDDKEEVENYIKKNS